ncbi:MAG: SH3 domain-containing protein [Sphingomonadaceae bacterium]|uniref:SH3 domain-containing protein n=1 Tax=Thermaurantiacus sp. TaxID=2820283 RepID=UPI00298F3464|nr:SH3 domain-containing protein [Thermaurantiacus sp.]MCS6987282.1 SH3 domain-containing protein [Sphingomonadaceae bacterium]MDW8414502.1 SH3 domain-containing protein [Thermaurantiacus sp.]
MILGLAALGVWGAMAPASAPAQPAPSAEALRHNSGLPLPRFASLRAGRAHLRAGPGREYPARLTFVRAGIPLKVLKEWNVWRQVQDADGAIGWVDRALLSTERTFQITGGLRTARARPDPAAPPVWRAEPGVVGRIVACSAGWCRIDVDGRAGWIPQDHGFGTLPGEEVDG